MWADAKLPSNKLYEGSPIFLRFFQLDPSALSSGTVHPQLLGCHLAKNQEWHCLVLFCLATSVAQAMSIPLASAKDGIPDE